MMFKKWFATRTAQKYLQEGKILLVQGEQKNAIEQFSKAIKLDRMLLDAYLNRAIAYYEIGDAENAIADLDYVLQYKPNIPAAYYWRGRAYMHIGETDLALRDIDEAIKLDPNEPANPLFRAFIHFCRKENDEAIKDTTRAIELGFEEEGYRNRAILFAQTGNYQAAIEDWTRVIALNPDDANAYCARGILLEKTGQFERALTDLKTGLQNKDDLEEQMKVESEKLMRKLKNRNP